MFRGSISMPESRCPTRAVTAGVWWALASVGGAGKFGRDMLANVSRASKNSGSGERGGYSMSLVSD